MQIRIEVFSEIVILEVSGDVTARSVAVLTAGMGKRIGPQSSFRWIFVDARKARLDAAAVSAAKVIRDTRQLQEHPILKKLVIVSENAELADFGTLEAAMINHPTSDTQLYLERLKLEQTREVLRKKKDEIEARSQSDSNSTEKDKITPKKLNTYLLKIKKVFKDEIKSLTLMIQKMKKSSPDKEVAEQLKKEEKRVLDEMKKKGIL